MHLFTISKFRYPKQIEDSFAGSNTSYTFYYEHDFSYKSFYEKYPINEFTYDAFCKIKDSYIKKLCFAFYVLYVKGGFFIDLNVIPNKEVINNYELTDNAFYCVKSILNDDNLFLGIFGSVKENKLLIQLLNYFLECANNASKITSNSICSYLKHRENEFEVIYLNEKVNHSDFVSTVTPCGKLLFDHYYKPNVCYKIPFQLKNVKAINNIKIGITLLIFDNVNTFFSNGINQNTLFLGELLLNIGFDVYFIVEDTKVFDIKEETIADIFYDNRFRYVKYSNILYEEFNVIITLSFSYGEMFIYNYLKYMNTKHIGYFCGNTYIIESEKILYNQHKLRQSDEYDFTINEMNKFDQIWSIPQMREINLDFWSILHRCKCIEVPFIWSNKAIQLYCTVNKCSENDMLYKNRGPEKKIAIFEPNISIMKWALPSVIICENAYRTCKNINHLYITNISTSNTNDFNVNQFSKLLKQLDIVKSNKCSIESRYNTLYFMKNFADIAISHQWGNPLNYLYLDLAWMGWPIIHNAYLCKDIGYYYDGYQLIEGSNVLTNVIEQHDFHIKEYLEKNRRRIDKYLPSNLELQETYKNLILNLFE
jgi:hypothetical protein